METTSGGLRADQAAILQSDDLFHRAGGIASWTESATYIVQPACPGLAIANQARLVELADGVTLEEFIGGTHKLFSEYGIGQYTIHLDTRSTPIGLGKGLIKKGFKETTIPVFTLESLPSVPGLPVHVLETNEEDVLRDFEEIHDNLNMASMDGELCMQYADLRRYRREAGLIREFVGYYRGQKAAVGSLLEVGPLMKLKDIRLDDEFAGLGVKQAMTAMIIITGFQSGANKAVIFEDDVESLDLIQNMGFVKAFDVYRYLKP